MYIVECMCDDLIYSFFISINCESLGYIAVLDGLYTTKTGTSLFYVYRPDELTYTMQGMYTIVLVLQYDVAGRVHRGHLSSPPPPTPFPP